MTLNKEFAEKLLNTAITQLKASTDYKRSRMAKIKDAEDMMLGKVKAKARQQFNVPLPVLSGFFDTLCADLDDPMSIKVKNSAGKNLEAVKGINEFFNIEKKSLKPNARWNYKDRISRKSAIASGRAFLKLFSTSHPYKTTIEAPNYAYMHVQPRGGGLLERHLFVGEEGIIKTKQQLKNGVIDDIYDKEQVQTLLDRAGSREYQEKMSAFQDDQARRFKALQLDPDNNNFVGEVTFNLCEWVMTKYGDRWYILFDPCTRTWLRIEKLTDIYPSGYYPWISYATHEDDENFWSTSILADILYPIADSIKTMFDQELTNRQKRNLNARAYDREMFKNVAKLDEAQYRPDTLIPADTFGGTRQIASGLYAFQTPELTGTVDLISWLTDFTGKNTGIYQDIKPSTPKGKSVTNNIIFAEIQQLAKRTDYRSHAYTEAWGELMLRYIDGVKKNLTKDEAIQLLGTDLGYEFVSNLKKLKVDKDDLLIISTKEQNQEDALKKQQKVTSLQMLINDQGINADWRRRHILTDIGGWEQEEVDEATDLREMGGKQDQLAFADEAINLLLKGKQPETCWNATVLFQRKILDFADQHRLALKEHFPDFINYIRSHNKIVMENMAQLALRMRAAAPQAATGGGQPMTAETAKPTAPRPAQPKRIPTRVAPQPSGQQSQPTPMNLFQ